MSRAHGHRGSKAGGTRPDADDRPDDNAAPATAPTDGPVWPAVDASCAGCGYPLPPYAFHPSPSEWFCLGCVFKGKVPAPSHKQPGRNPGLNVLVPVRFVPNFFSAHNRARRRAQSARVRHRLAAAQTVPITAAAIPEEMDGALQKVDRKRAVGLLRDCVWVPGALFHGLRWTAAGAATEDGFGRRPICLQAECGRCRAYPLIMVAFHRALVQPRADAKQDDRCLRCFLTDMDEAASDSTLLAGYFQTYRWTATFAWLPRASFVAARTLAARHSLNEIVDNPWAFAPSDLDLLASPDPTHPAVIRNKDSGLDRRADVERLLGRAVLRIANSVYCRLTESEPDAVRLGPQLRGLLDLALGAFGCGGSAKGLNDGLMQLSALEAAGALPPCDTHIWRGPRPARRPIALCRSVFHNEDATTTVSSSFGIGGPTAAAMTALVRLHPSQTVAPLWSLGLRTAAAALFPHVVLAGRWPSSPQSNRLLFTDARQTLPTDNSKRPETCREKVAPPSNVCKCRPPHAHPQVDRDALPENWMAQAVDLLRQAWALAAALLPVSAKLPPTALGPLNVLLLPLDDGACANRTHWDQMTPDDAAARPPLDDIHRRISQWLLSPPRSVAATAKGTQQQRGVMVRPQRPRPSARPRCRPKRLSPMDRWRYPMGRCKLIVGRMRADGVRRRRVTCWWGRPV